MPATVNLPDRITQLESLVKSLMENINNPEKETRPEQLQQEPQQLPQPRAQSPSAAVQEQSTESSPQDSTPLGDSFGRISLEKSETTYVESIHWTAILDEVRLLLPFSVI